MRDRYFIRYLLPVFLATAAVEIGLSAIADLGELVHFNCRLQNGEVICELTHEPLLGRLRSQQFPKSILLRTGVESRQNWLGQPTTRLVLLTSSQQVLPLTRHWSTDANEQLFAQRDQIDQFLTTASAKTLSVRTHRPGQLWVILAGLCIATGTVCGWLYSLGSGVSSKL